MAFENRLVVLVNKDIEIGVAMNAVGHVSLALGAVLGKEQIHLQQYKDKSQNIWPISGMPYIMLKGKSKEIYKAISAAKDAGILQISFVETMTGGSYEEQLLRTSQNFEEDHNYIAAALYGKLETVKEITKKFSLYK